MLLGVFGSRCYLLKLLPSGSGLCSRGKSEIINFINLACEGRADTTEHMSAGGSCQARAATRHNPLVATEA